MSFDADTLLRLLPAIYRLRDEELAGGKDQDGPLQALLAVFAEEFAGIEENLAQLYDDQFVETCADWAIPYLGDLIGYEPLHALGQARGLSRAEVAHTIALRRRKGTAAALEQLARDVTGWHSRAVEYFQLLGTTQYLNHLRPHSRYAPDLRQWEPLARIGGAFESLAHTVDVRRIASGRGRFNVPNVGIHLWRLGAYRHSKSPAVPASASAGERRFLVSPLGHPLQLYTDPVAEDEISHLAEPINVPEPIRRRVLHDHLADYYGEGKSLLLHHGATPVTVDQVVACNLSDDGPGWAHDAPSQKIAIDPELGRLVVAADFPLAGELRVSYHYGCSADLGGGEYFRERAPDPEDVPLRRVPQDHATIQAALAALNGAGIVEISDSGRYEATLSVNVAEGRQLALRAAPQCRPTLVLGGDLEIRGGAGSAFTLDGLLVAGGRLRVPGDGGNQLARLQIVHATLVPGLSLDAAGEPLSPDQASLQVELAAAAVEIERSILGATRVHEDASVSAKDSIFDATGPERLAYGGSGGGAPGATLSLDACTVIGKVHALALEMISNSLLVARAAPGDALPPVVAQRRQSGCVRFSFLPFASLVPHLHRCQPDSAAGASRVTPHFSSLRYGTAAYCQLARSTPDEIRRGADDESEMGAFHALYAPQRETNLQIRLREFLRAGLSAGIFYET